MRKNATKVIRDSIISTYPFSEKWGLTGEGGEFTTYYLESFKLYEIDA